MSIARRRWGWPLVPVYRGAQRLEGALRERGALRTKYLGWPVISVGSLAAGGAGKTPVVIALVEMLRSAGWHVDVLTRGYGRHGSGVEQVNDLEHAMAASLKLDGEQLEARLAEHSRARVADLPKARVRERHLLVDAAADRYGDEPVLIAARTAAPVWVGADRWAAGLAAERELAQAEFDPSLASHRAVVNDRCVHVLDDGFQHRKLARDFDIVLVTAEDLNDALLPAGNLREPLKALRRADAVVVREEEIAELKEKLWPLLRTGTQVWTVRRRLRFPAPLGVLTAGLRPLAFCAIARPEGFAAALTQAGCGIIDTVLFGDHQRLYARQLDEIVRFGKQLNASGLVTTEKDFVKLSWAALTTLREQVGPLCVVALDAQFAEPERIAQTVLAKLGRAAP